MWTPRYQLPQSTDVKSCFKNMYCFGKRMESNSKSTGDFELYVFSCLGSQKIFKTVLMSLMSDHGKPSMGEDAFEWCSCDKSWQEIYEREIIAHSSVLRTQHMRRRNPANTPGDSRSYVHICICQVEARMFMYTVGSSVTG